MTEFPKKTAALSQLADKVYHIIVHYMYIHLVMSKALVAQMQCRCITIRSYNFEMHNMQIYALEFAISQFRIYKTLGIHSEISDNGS